MQDLGSMELLPRIENEHNRQQRAGSQEEEKKNEAKKSWKPTIFSPSGIFSLLYFLQLISWNESFRWEIAEFIISRFISREEIDRMWVSMYFFGS